MLDRFRRFFEWFDPIFESLLKTTVGYNLRQLALTYAQSNLAKIALELLLVIPWERNTYIYQLSYTISEVLNIAYLVEFAFYADNFLLAWITHLNLP